MDIWVSAYQDKAMSYSTEIHANIHDLIGVRINVVQFKCRVSACRSGSTRQLGRSGEIDILVGVSAGPINATLTALRALGWL